MVLGLTIAVFVTVYIVIVAVGLVLLVAAILRRLYEGLVDGRSKWAPAAHATPDGEMKSLSLQSSPTDDPAAEGGADIERWQASASRENGLPDFDGQRQALSCDLRYVVTVTGSHY